MGGQEDDGVIDEEERHHIDEAWRKARRTKLVREAGEREVDRSMISEGKRRVSFWGGTEGKRRVRKSVAGSLAMFCDLPLLLIGS
jgi:hypothetical protein